MAASNFDAVLPLVLKHEGGWSDHPRDPGGATNLGITRATLSGWLGRQASKAEVRALTVEKVKPIYRKNYWDKIAGDDLPAGVDYAVFDFAVNSGPARAAKNLQRIAGVPQDGIIGVQTLRAIKAIPAGEVVQRLCADRLAFLKGLGTWSTFGKGWASRVDGVRATALRMALDWPVTDNPGNIVVPTPKAEQRDTSLTEIIKKPEAWGPLGGLLTAMGAIFQGSGPIQWALGAAVVVGIGIGLFSFIKRVRAEA